MAKGIRNIWIDSDTPESIGNKVIRDGVEIADVLNGIQKYDDPDVVVNRQYKYVIQSYTATGQSTDEVLGDNLNYYTIVEAGDLKPIMTNFRVNEATPNHIHFDAPLGPVAGQTIQGFFVSGNTVTDIDTTLGYITVGTAFTFWDNNTIRLENGDGPVFDFTMEYIDNQIDEPSASANRYVTAVASGGGDGLTEGTAWTMAEVRYNVASGQTVWIKAGEYGNTVLEVRTISTPTNPVKLIGYKNTIGDITIPMVDSFVYTSHAQAMAFIDPTEYPVITGSGTDDNEDNVIIKYAQNVILKNIQSRNAAFGYSILEDIVNVHTENILAGNIITPGGYGRGFWAKFNTTNVRVVDSVFFDCGVNNMQVDGNNMLAKGCNASSGEFSNATDYWIVTTAGDNIIFKDNKAIRVGNPSHSGHGVGAKSDKNDPIEHLLVDNNYVENISESLMLAHEHVAYCVVKRNNVKGDISKSDGMVNRDGAHDNVFEMNYIEDVMQAITQWRQGAENPDHASDTLSLNNTFRNNIINNYHHAFVFVVQNQAYPEKVENMKVFNNTFYNGSGSYIYYNINSSTINFINNQITNNIFHTLSGKWLNSATPSDSFIETNNNYYNITATGYSLPANNISVDPEFNNTNQDGFAPTATFDTIDAPRLAGIEYDIYGSERSDPTTIGAVKNTNEV